MSEKIEYTDFCIEAGTFSCKVKSSKRENADILTFETNPPVKNITTDAIALALATLCGRTYHSILFDVKVSTECVNSIKKFTGAEVQTKGHCVKSLPESREIAMLNFSGGFDSLAAMCLLPEDSTKLVAVDFGGWFEREAVFFERFRPYILKTNFRKLKYDRESWTFMGTGALLFQAATGARYNIFGTILEATIGQFWERPPAAYNVKTLPFSELGLKDVRLVNGLTEVGTAIIVTHFMPEIIADSLQSLAAPKSEKKYRKRILTEIVCKRFNRDIDLGECEIPDKKNIVSFGTNFALDFLSLYELKHVGRDIVSNTVSNIPDEALKLVEQLSLEFYEKLNTNFVDTIPQSMRALYFSRLAEAGIQPYSEEDWKEFKTIKRFLSQFYPALVEL